jgi:hypothetical protein
MCSVPVSIATATLVLASRCARMGLRAGVVAVSQDHLFDDATPLIGAHGHNWATDAGNPLGQRHRT